MRLVTTLIIIFILFTSNAYSRTNLSETEIMALNVYHEARGEPLNGQLAIMRVVMNRLQDPRFPKRIHDIILQKNNNTCQFTWVCYNTLRIPTNDPQWHYILMITDTFMRNHYYIHDNTDGALFFRRIRNSNTNYVIINNHIFYR